MPYFDWLPELDPDDDTTGPTAQDFGVSPDDPAWNVTKKKANPADARRAVVSQEDAAVKLEQDAIRRAHAALSDVTKWSEDSTYPDAKDPSIHQVKDALDKGALKPHQVAADLEELLKKKWSYPGLPQALSSSLNDLKIAQQQRAEVNAKAATIEPRPETPPELYAKDSEGAFEQAKKLRTEAGNVGVLGQGKRLQEAKNLEAQAESLQRLAQERQPGAPTENAEFGKQNPPDFDSVFKASGMTRKTFLTKAAALLQTIGMTSNSVISPATFGQALTSVYASMGDAGIALMDGTDKAGNPKKPQQQQNQNGRMTSTPPDQQYNDPYQQRIMQQQQEISGAIREIKNLKTFDSTWKVVLYALFSVIMGPGPAAVLFTNKAKRGELKWEIDRLEHDLNATIHQQSSYQQMRESARHNAAMEGLQRDRLDHDIYKDEEYIKLRKMMPQGKDPDYEDALHGYRLQKDALDEIEKVLNNQFNFTPADIKDANAKLPKAKNNVVMARNNVLKILNQKGEARATAAPTGAGVP